MIDKVCPYCNRPLMKIDHYGKVLVGYIDCNRWGHPGDDKLIMELMESDLEALRGIRHDGANRMVLRRLRSASFRHIVWSL
jgi:hypothetical protein